MSLWVVEEKYFIEDYYPVDVFQGVFTTIELAHQYIEKRREGQFKEHWVDYLREKFTDEAMELHAEKLAELSKHLRIERESKPRYKGLNNDKLALEFHAKLKEEWSQRCEIVSEAYHDYMDKYIYEPSNLAAEKLKDSNIPIEIRENFIEKEQISEFKITETETDIGVING